jgi:transcriptional regulator GlxA family with amidase domain
MQTTRARANGRPSVRPRRVAMVVYDDANTVDVTGPLEVFAAASLLLEIAGRPRAYENVVVSATGATVRTSSGVRLIADHLYSRFDERVDTLLVAGGDPTGVMQDKAFLRWVASRRRRVRRLGSVCSGAFVLAAAGLLDGRRATTHWSAVDLLGRAFPRVQVEPDAIWVEDDGIYTSAGVTAGMDLALALVEEDHGRTLALDVARQLVLFLKRPGGQRQFSTVLAAQSAPEGALAGISEWLLEHLGEDLRVERLAERAAMSPRNFARVFTRELGTTPAKFVERARVERARLCLERGDATVDSVAWECGFGNSERMRRTFRRHLGVVPQDYRKVFENAARA